MFSLKLLVVGLLAVVLAPGFLTARTAVTSLRELSAASETRVHQLVSQVKAARAIVERTAEVERKARLMVVLSDPLLSRPYERESYESAHVAFRRALDDLLSASMDQRRVELINRLSDRERMIHDRLTISSMGNDLKPPDDQSFQSLRMAASDLWREVVEAVNREGDQISEESRSFEARVWTEATRFGLIPVAAVLALAGLMIPSMRQLRLAARQLAAGHTADPIRVGPLGEFRALGQQLERLRMQMVHRSEAGARLIRGLSQEIAAPLATVCRDLHALGLSPPEVADPQHRAVLADLGRESKRLEDLLEQLQRYDGFNKGTPNYPRTAVNIETLIDDVLRAAAPRIQSRSLVITKSMAPVDVLADPAQMRALVEALLDNAIRYTPAEREIQIILRAVGPWMKLEIEDDGPGITDDERVHVFEPFFRGRTALDRGEPGLGLGLSIAAACAANHEGRIEIVDPRHPKRGARFRIQIPLVPDSADAA